MREDIEWGVAKRGINVQPHPSWLVMLVRMRHNTLWEEPAPANTIDWYRVAEYRVPMDYITLSRAKEPSQQEMRQHLAKLFVGIPDELIRIDPLEEAYNKTNPSVKWEDLSCEERNRYWSVFKTGTSYSNNQRNDLKV